MIKTSLSGFHRMVVTVMKTSFYVRLNPRVINYRDYKSFGNKTFREELLHELSNTAFGENASDFEKFIDMRQKNLNLHASTKQMYVRATICHLLTKPFQKQ